MDPALIKLLTAVIQVGAEFMAAYPALREAASTEDKATLDAAYARYVEASNAVADRLRVMPDDG